MSKHRKQVKPKFPTGVYIRMQDNGEGGFDLFADEKLPTVDSDTPCAFYRIESVGQITVDRNYEI